MAQSTTQFSLPLQMSNSPRLSPSFLAFSMILSAPFSLYQSMPSPSSIYQGQLIDFALPPASRLLLRLALSLYSIR